ncbi:MAG: hypothetical protein ACRDT6_06825 [Micromonosporaceae bacterium]
METFADVLRAARSRRFVGREAELALLAEVVRRHTPVRVLAVHAPAGVGKSTLLRAFRAEAARLGANPVAVDLRTTEARPQAFLTELTERGFPAHPAGDLVVTVDTYERAGALDAWIRESWLPSLPHDTVVVLAGRERLDPLWRTDPGWQELVRELNLRNFTRDETLGYLRLAGVDPRHHARAAALTHGHALAVSLLADLLRQRPELRLDSLADAPDVLRALVRRYVDTLPDPSYERALRVCAHAWTTTEDLLRDVLREGPDVGPQIAWLRELSFVEEGPYGLHPHDLAREVLDTDLRWRDPAGYTELHRRLQDATVRRARALTGAEQQRAIMHLVFVHRGSPLTAAYWDFAQLGQAYADQLRPGDAAHLVAMIERNQGAEQAALVRYWLGRQPAAFRVFRTAEPEPAGFGMMLRLDLTDESDRARDPAVAGVWELIASRRPLRPGDHASLMRFFTDAERDQAPSRSLNLGAVLSIQMLITDPAVAWDFISFAEDGAKDGLMEFIDYARFDEAGYRVGDRCYAVYGRDFRGSDAVDWLHLLAGRELGEPIAPSAPASGPELALSYPEFADAVKQALKDLGRPERLAANPLTRGLLVRDAGTRTPAERLAELIREAAGELAGHPRDGKLHRALDRTYLRPAPTQEIAAELLGLPFSTYRRHLTQGIERVIDKLWRRELG